MAIKAKPLTPARRIKTLLRAAQMIEEAINKADDTYRDGHFFECSETLRKVERDIMALAEQVENFRLANLP